MPGSQPPWDVGDLDLAHHREGPLDEFDQVALPDLRMVEVEIHAQVRIVDVLDQRQGIGSAGERGARVVDRGVEVLQGEHPARPLAEFAPAG